MEQNKKKARDTQEIILKVFGYTILTLSLLYTAFVIFGRLIPNMTTHWFFNSIDIFKVRNAYNPWIRSLSYVVSVFAVSYLLRRVIELSFRWLKRGRAIVSLFCSFLKYVAAVIIIFAVLATFGVDTNALIAGLGILSLIVGLAIQPLLQDIIAGIFVVFEKTYDVGDVVVVDSFRGTVTEIGIRTTKIKDAGGDIKVINNSDIRTLVNMTGDLSYAISEVDIEYGESLERVEQVIADNLSSIQKNIPDIIDGPYYKGVVALGASGVKLRLIAQCKEDAKFQVQRDLNRQIKLIFDANRINIPFTQVVVHQAKEISTPVGTGATNAFIQEQNELSRGFGDDDESHA